MNHSFFVRTVATTRFYFTCLLLNISAPHCGDLVPGRLTNEGTRRWQMSANGSRECVHDHDRSPLCGFGIRRRRFGRHDGCGCGGSLMTPLLILLFGIHPATAVGTDLLYAAATKTGGTIFHGFAKTIDWRVVARLALGSVPTTIATLLVLSVLDVKGSSAQHLITVVLGGALYATSVVLLFH